MELAEPCMDRLGAELSLPERGGPSVGASELPDVQTLVTPHEWIVSVSRAGHGTNTCLLHSKLFSASSSIGACRSLADMEGCETGQSMASAGSFHRMTRSSSGLYSAVVL